MTPATVVCLLSIPVAIIMLGGMWAVAPTICCTTFESLTRYPKITLVQPDAFGEDRTEWALAESRARAILVGILTALSLAGSFTWVLKEGSANHRLHATAESRADAASSGT